MKKTSVIFCTLAALALPAAAAESAPAVSVTAVPAEAPCISDADEDSLDDEDSRDALAWELNEQISDALAEHRMEDALAIAIRLRGLYASDKQSEEYISAQLWVVTFHFYLRNFQEAIREGEPLLAGGLQVLPPAFAKSDGRRLRFFMVRSYYEVGEYAKSLELGVDFLKEDSLDLLGQQVRSVCYLSLGRVGTVGIRAMGEEERSVFLRCSYDFLTHWPTPQSSRDVCALLSDWAETTGDYAPVLEFLRNALQEWHAPSETSAVICATLMNLYGKRNRPASGSHEDGTYTPSDHWCAWYAGDQYMMRLMLSSLFVPADTPEGAAYDYVLELTERYNTPEVQAENAAIKPKNKH